MGKIKKWLPQEGKRVEVRHPVTGRKVGISEHAGFWLILTLAVVIVLVGAMIFH